LSRGGETRDNSIGRLAYFQASKLVTTFKRTM
jgi:hypothetical protein